MKDEFEFLELDSDALVQAGLHDLPFPIRKTHSKAVVLIDSMSLPGLLQELDAFVEAFPEHLRSYQFNITKLAFICASKQMQEHDTKGALSSLSIGLKADSENSHLRIHQALLFQSLGYTEFSSAEYDTLLRKEPMAYDPFIRALATKAHLAKGDLSAARHTLEALPESAFEDEDLQKLRFALIDQMEGRDAFAESQNNQSDAISSKPEGASCNTCNTPVRANTQFCTNCGAKH